MQVAAVLEKFKDVHELPVGIEEIQDAVLEVSDVDSIYIYETKAQTDIIYGVFMRYAPMARPYADAEEFCEIGVASNLPQEWRRMVVAKELMHCLDEVPEVSSTPEDIAALVSDLTMFDGGRDQTDQLKAEMLALGVALVVLVPLAARNVLVKKYHENSINDNDVAKLANIPEVYVPWVMSDHYDRYINRFLPKLAVAK